MLLITIAIIVRRMHLYLLMSLLMMLWPDHEPFLNRSRACALSTSSSPDHERLLYRSRACALSTSSSCYPLTCSFVLCLVDVFLGLAFGTRLRLSRACVCLGLRDWVLSRSRAGDFEQVTRSRFFEHVTCLLFRQFTRCFIPHVFAFEITRRCV